MTKEFEKFWMAQFKVRIAYDASNRIQYVGEAADSNRNFDNEWDERANYTYG